MEKKRNTRETLKKLAFERCTWMTRLIGWIILYSRILMRMENITQWTRTHVSTSLSLQWTNCVLPVLFLKILFSLLIGTNKAEGESRIEREIFHFLNFLSTSVLWNLSFIQSSKFETFYTSATNNATTDGFMVRTLSFDSAKRERFSSPAFPLFHKYKYNVWRDEVWF